MIWMDACFKTIQKRRSHPSTQRAVFLEVVVNSNEHTLMQCIIPLGLGFKPCLHGNCCNDDKFSVSINKMAKKKEKIHNSVRVCVRISLMHTSHVLHWRGTSTPQDILHGVPHRRNEAELVCQSLYLQSAGSDFKSAKYFRGRCKSWNVYLQGYLHLAAHSPEDESSTGYIQYIWGELWISSWRRM